MSLGEAKNGWDAARLNWWQIIGNTGGLLVAVYIFHRWLCADWPFNKSRDIPYLGQPPEDDE